MSTPQRLEKLGLALGTPARLFRFPGVLLEAGATILGKREMLRQLCGSLCVDISKTRELLGWSPPITVDEGISKASLGWKPVNR